MTLFQSLITLREGIMIGDPVPIINNSEGRDND